MIPAERERVIASFIIEAAQKAGIRVVGTDGYWLDVLYPKGLPRDVESAFSRAFSEHRDAIIALIEETGRVGADPPWQRRAP